MALHRTSPEIDAVIADLAADGRRPFALAVVLRDAGSTPRKAGTKAVIDAAGEIWGTIGGGLLEDQARRMAVEAIRTGRPAVFDFRFAGTDPHQGDPVCGGTMRILIAPLDAAYREAYARAADDLRRRRRGAMVTTVLGHDDTARVRIDWLPSGDGWTDGQDPATAAVRDAAARGRAVSFGVPATALNPSAVEGLAEPLLPTPLLLVAGGGHVGQALARQAGLVGFDVVVTDDRPEFADAALFPPGVAVRCADVGNLASDFSINEDTYVAVVGRGHLVDARALAACIGKPAAYIGMMGSRRKVALLRREFLESGRCTAEQFDRVHAPIGLAIGAETVPEIAASIVAQLVAVRRTGASPRPVSAD